MCVYLSDFIHWTNWLTIWKLNWFTFFVLKLAKETFDRNGFKRPNCNNLPDSQNIERERRKEVFFSTHTHRCATIKNIENEKERLHVDASKKKIFSFKFYLRMFKVKFLISMRFVNTWIESVDRLVVGKSSLLWMTTVCCGKERKQDRKNY